MYVDTVSLKLESESENWYLRVKIGGSTGTGVLNEFLLCFRLDPRLLSMMDLSTIRIMSSQIVIPRLASC